MKLPDDERGIIESRNVERLRFRSENNKEQVGRPM
jgi:hypothetical protein